MKQYFIILALVFGLSTISFAQRKLTGASIGPDGRSMSDKSKKDDSKMLDSLGYNVESVIKTWKFTDMNSSREEFKLDTILGEIQNYNTIYRKSISNSYLGNLGAAYQSNIYIDREKDGFLFFDAYRAYIVKPEDIVYFNTTTPYTRLFYETGGPKGQSENLLKVLQTQNISPNWNFGIKYDLISSDGQYQNQKTKLYDLTLFSSYKKRNYGMNMVLNMNRISANENGGIVNDSLVTDGDEESENIQVNLTQARSKFTNFNLFMNHSYGIGKEKEIVIEKDTTYSYAIDLLYTLNYEKNSWQFKDDNLNKDFYPTGFLLNQNSTFDKVEQSLVKNTFQIVFNENENKWIRLGARFGIESEFLKYNLRRNVTQYAWQQKDANIHNNQLVASLFSLSGKSANWKAVGKYVFEGYRQNDFDLDYQFIKWFGEKNSGHGFKLSGRLESTTPNYIMEKYYGNHQQWDLKLDKQTELRAGVEYFNKNYRFKIGANFSQIDNYTYFGLNATPEQAAVGISVLTGYLQKNFKLGNFYLNQSLVGQNSSNEKLLPLPTLSIYSNNYYKNEFFNGALGLQTGVSIHYNTSFYAPNYMPATGQFFLQEQKELGDYPKVNVYFNFRIKRTRLFIMYEHANASIGSKNYFSALHYPINPSMLKYGLIWTFYN